MKFKDPLEQYLWKWYKEKKTPGDSPEIGGVIIKIAKDSTNRLAFILTTSKETEIYKWWSHFDTGLQRDNWLKEYAPTKEEKRRAIKSVFVLENSIKTA